MSSGACLFCHESSLSKLSPQSSSSPSLYSLVHDPLALNTIPFQLLVDTHVGPSLTPRRPSSGLSHAIVGREMV